MVDIMFKDGKHQVYAIADCVLWDNGWLLVYEGDTKVAGYNPDTLVGYEIFSKNLAGK